MRTMRRLVTLALALGLTALVAAAAVDTLRGEEVRRADPPTPRDNDTESVARRARDRPGAVASSRTGRRSQPGSSATASTGPSS